jgi:predicted Zn-dependent protease
MTAERDASKPFCVRKLAKCAVTIALIVGFCFSGIHAGASEPKPKRPFYNHFSSEDEARLGAALAGNIERDGIPFAGGQGEQQTARIKRDLAVERYLESIASKLSQCSQRPEVQYSVRVLDAPAVINAFSIPGGHLYVTSGLLLFVQTEPELAAVLAHEIGHIVGRHSLNRIARVSLFTLLLDQVRGSGLISDDAAAQKFADSAMSLLFAVDARTFYSRDEEIEADLLGFHELTRAGWDPQGEVTLLARLAQASPEQGPLAALIATHPNSSDRLLIVQNEYRAAGSPVGFRQESIEFIAMKRMMRSGDNGAPSLWLSPLILIGIGVCAALALLFARLLWSRRQQAPWTRN